MSDRIRFRLQFDRFAGLYLWLAFIAIFGAWKPDLFLTTATLHSVASANAATALLALAVLIPLCAGAYDLSAGAAMNLATVVAVWLQTERGVPMVPAVVAAVLVGVLIGLVNGVVVVRFKVNSFIATLGMSSVALAVQAMIVGATQPVPPNSPAWVRLTTTTVFGFQIIVVYVLVIAFAVWWLLSRMTAGRYIYAVGGNADAARLAGVHVGRHVLLGFVLSGLIAGIGGVLYGSLYGPSLTYGPALLLPAFAAAFLGSVLLRGTFNAWGTVAAVYILATGIQGLQFVTSAQWLGDLFNGVVLVVAVAFAKWRQSVAGAKRARAKAEELRLQVDADGVAAGHRT
ncbi:ABC transporter permease [Thermopolyspora sp. NPDC052614]|uniref:ABC transporter permease n=1 Tax=Thermopolyspora sp. NPDC052614 TaxID=3155682 RepID=UPI0034468F8F